LFGSILLCLLLAHLALTLLFGALFLQLALFLLLALGLISPLLLLPLFPLLALGFGLSFSFLFKTPLFLGFLAGTLLLLSLPFGLTLLALFLSLQSLLLSFLLLGSLGGGFFGSFLSIPARFLLFLSLPL
jgi:hypothetical protein